jgi:hypothetical protein
MQCKLLSLKSLIVGLVVVLLGCAIVALGSLSAQSGPGIAEAQQQKNAVPTPVPPGTEVPADPALLQALSAWVPTASAIRQISPAPGGRDTELSDCHSGKVNFTVTHGWCYASAVRLFYNVSLDMFKDPRTGQIFTFDVVQSKLFAAGRADDVQQGLEPPTLPEKHAAKSPPETVSMQCTKGQQQDINKHVQNLDKDAKRSDSPIMQALFTEQAQWWQNLCP